MEAFVLALRGWFVRLPGDRFDPQGANVRDQLAEPSSSGRVQRGAIVREQSLRDPVRGDAFPHHRDRGFGRFPGGDVGGDREAGMVIDELEDHAFTAAGEDVLGRVELPACSSVPGKNRRYAARGFFLGSVSRHRRSRKMRQRCHRRHRFHAQRSHPFENTDRAVVEARTAPTPPAPECLRRDLLTDLDGLVLRPSGPRFQRCSRPLRPGPGPDHVKRLTRDAMLETERSSPLPAAASVATE